MRYVLTVVFVLTGGAAAADPGHLIELAGHDHWVGGAAIGLAILAGLWGVLKGGDDAEEEAQEETEEEVA
ncbi:MAG: hypothetical protein KC448_06575 [Yoonia sp.]|nr:hypothetical protein [Yoonia sp.]